MIAAPASRSPTAISPASPILAASAAGETLGYAVVEGLAVGRTTLRLGSQEIELQITDDSVAAYSGRIMAPASGADRLGRDFRQCRTAGAPDWPEGQPPTLQIGTGRAVEPEWTNEPESGPTGLASYRIDLSTLPEGPLSLALIEPGRPDPVDSVNISILATGNSMWSKVNAKASTTFHPFRITARSPPPSWTRAPRSSGGRYWNAASGAPRF